MSGGLDDTLTLEALSFVHSLLHQYRTACFEASHVDACITIVATLVVHKWYAWRRNPKRRTGSPPIHTCTLSLLKR